MLKGPKLLVAAITVWFWLLLAFCIFLCGWSVLVWALPSMFPSTSFSADNEISLFAVTLGSSFVFPRIYGEHVQIRERQRAIMGEPSLMAEARWPSSPPDVTQTDDAITVRWQRPKASRLFWAGAAGVLTLACAGMITGLALATNAVGGVWPLVTQLGDVSMILLLVFTAIVGGMLAAGLRLFEPEQGVIVDGTGVRAPGHRGGRRRITWDECRLLEAEPITQGGFISVRYRLYGVMGTTVSWLDLAPVATTYRAIGASHEEMSRRAKAALARVMTNTGLTPRTLHVKLARDEQKMRDTAYFVYQQALNPPVTLILILITFAAAPPGLAVLSYGGILASMSAGTSVVGALTLTFIVLFWASWKDIRLEPPHSGSLPIPSDSAVAYSAQTRPGYLALITGGCLAVGAGALLGLAQISIASVAGIAEPRPDFTAVLVCYQLITIGVASSVLLAVLMTRRELVIVDAEDIFSSSGGHTAGDWIPLSRIHFLGIGIDRHGANVYTVKTASGKQITWTGQSRVLRQAPLDATTAQRATTVDGDTLAAIVAARTGLKFGQPRVQ